jgi:hypothetical protein
VYEDGAIEDNDTWDNGPGYNVPRDPRYVTMNIPTKSGLALFASPIFLGRLYDLIPYFGRSTTWPIMPAGSVVNRDRSPLGKCACDSSVIPNHAFSCCISYPGVKI